ncbi:MAG: transcription antitermination factor NusB [Cyanobacteria bacterium P01_H01_bin.74]
MSARRASRELALLTLFQADKQLKPDTTEKSIHTGKMDKASLEKLLLGAIQLLVDDAKIQIQSAAADMNSALQFFTDYQDDAPENLSRPMGVLPKTVALDNTKAVIEKLELCLRAADQVYGTFRLPELNLHASVGDVTDYALELSRLVLENQESLDAQINSHLSDWRIERLLSLDACLIRLAVAEMMYIKTVDCSVSINEAIELAKLYASEESYKLINGVLGAVAETLGEPRIPGT